MYTSGSKLSIQEAESHCFNFKSAETQTHRARAESISTLPELKSGREGRIPEVTIVGTELVMELGGASMPDGCNGGSGGGGPAANGKWGGGSG